MLASRARADYSFDQQIEGTLHLSRPMNVFWMRQTKLLCESAAERCVHASVQKLNCI